MSMLGVLGLALAGPFITLPSLAYGDPTLMALAADPAQMRLYCYSTRCGDEEWRLALAPPQPVPRTSSRKHAIPPRKPVALPGSRSLIGLSAPATPRNSKASYSNDWRVGTRYGVQALRQPDTQLGVQVGAGYRLMPMHDDGINQPGPVLRGELNFGQSLGERAQWTQRVQFETGGGEAFVKQSIGVEVELWPEWTLETDYVIRHDTYGGGGSQTAESWMGLRRHF